MTPTEKLRTLQEEQKPWVKHNFGNRPGWMPLLGIIEELGEHEEAVIDGEPLGKVIDALADAMIFAADYCSAMDWDFGDLWDEAMTYGQCEVTLLSAVGRISHAYLKQQQGIRIDQDHDGQGRKGMVFLLVDLRILASKTGISLVDETWRVWQKVKLRDWKKDPTNAGQKKDCHACGGMGWTEGSAELRRDGKTGNTTCICCGGSGKEP